MDRVRPAFEELMGVWFSHADTLGKAKSTRMFHLLEGINDQDDEASSAFVEFTFTARARQMLERSEVYARLSREAIIKFQSRYSLRLYEIGAAIYCKRDPTWSGEVAELRKLLHVTPDTYPNFSDFRKRVLEPAKAEIAQLAEFDFSWEEITSGRQVRRIRMIFTAKPGHAALAAAEENERHSVGRKPRREGDVGQIVTAIATKLTVTDQRPAPALSAPASDELAWPRDDDLNDYDEALRPLYLIARSHGGGHSVERLSYAYVQHMGEKRHLLRGDRLKASWQGFVAGKARMWVPVR
jgi:hypothetical protein